ncbi:MAG: FHA domain-containing protein, partial [Actinomycetes bacterium]
MPDRCEVLPGDSVVARRGGGLRGVDAPGSPALVAALHACLGVTGPGADRVLSAVAGQVGSLANGAASFALVLADTAQGAGTGVALWSGKGQPAVDGVPVSGSSSVEGCTLATGFQLGQTLYVGPGQAAPQMPPGVAYDLVEGTVPGSGAMLQLAAAAPSSSAVPPATGGSSSLGASSSSGAGFGARSLPVEQPASGEQTAFWRPDADTARRVVTVRVL